MENFNQNNKIKKSFKETIMDNINIGRADSGFNRLLISLTFLALSCFTIYLGYKLVVMGTRGEFAIFSEYKGFSLTFWSLSPGLLFLISGIALLIFALPKSLKAFFDFNRNK